MICVRDCWSQLNSSTSAGEVLTEAEGDDGNELELWATHVLALNEMLRTGILPQPDGVAAGDAPVADAADAAAAVDAGYQNGVRITIKVTGDYKAMAAFLGVGAHNVGPELYNAWMIKETGRWVARTLADMLAEGHGCIGKCPRCGAVFLTEADLQAEVERKLLEE
ncbi:hypothetical protein T492DRAFT_458412 [Pavlovales sp. CCMP2436]|nr:hypothetical protein T492DRAFT_458412 [Pavlovales sp. CCMP2436]|mmetsp:Transcript_1738/g.4360  ORF Transcript_1738/g.4360 Transcript_1738/m.4360 type:complete len:166 (+) Transcript_1738:543-1040(+)